MNTTNKDTSLGLLLAAPIIAFPFGSAYAAFYVLIILSAVFLKITPSFLNDHKELQYSTLALALPILITALYLLFQGSAAVSDSLKKFALFSVSGLLAFSAAALTQSARTRAVAAAATSITIAFWIFDGLIQLTLGKDLFGIAPTTSQRISAFFETPTRYGYFIGFFTALPVFWLLSKKKIALAVVCLAGGGVVSLSGGSRFGMIGYILLITVFVLVLARNLARNQQILLFTLTPIALISAGLALYAFSPSFTKRIDDTLIIMQGIDRDTLNLMLTYRLEIWEPLLILVKQHWLFGIGVDQLEHAIAPYLAADSWFAKGDIPVMHAHQAFLEVLAATGIIGFVSFTCYYGWHCIAMLRSWPHASTFGWGCLLVFALMWFPVGSHKDIYSSVQALLSFYLLGMGFGFLRNDTQ